MGDAVAVSPAERAAPVDKRVVQAEVASFVQSTRSVTADVIVEKNNVYRAFAMVENGDPAFVKLTEWFQGVGQGGTPFVKAQTETVEVQIVATIPQSPKTWQVDWVEITRDRSGQATQPPERLRGLFTTKLVAPTADTTEKALRDNPLGLFISDFSWSRVA
jgi:type IV secretion system protein VirB5